MIISTDMIALLDIQNLHEKLYPSRSLIISPSHDVGVDLLNGTLITFRSPILHLLTPLQYPCPDKAKGMWHSLFSCVPTIHVTQFISSPKIWTIFPSVLIHRAVFFFFFNQEGSVRLLRQSHFLPRFLSMGGSPFSQLCPAESSCCLFRKVTSDFRSRRSYSL